MKTRGRQHAMRTLVVLHSHAASGPPQHVFSWLAPLAERGPLAAVVPAAGSAEDLYATIGTTAVLPYDPLTYPGRVAALGGYVAGLAADVRTFSRFMRRFRPDLVVVVTAALPAALVATRLQRVPTVVFVGEILDKGYVISRGRRLGAAAMTWLTGALADGVVCCSDAVGRQFAPRRRRLLTTIYPGVDGTHADGDGARFRAQHGLGDADPCLAVVGNVTPARGQDVVIRALPALRAEFPRIRCVIAGVPHQRAGDLAYREELATLARRLGVDDVVSFVGLVDPIADLYAAADVVVNPVRVNESFGRVAVEALSAGCPVVAARVGAIPEVVRDGREALLFEAGDHEALGEAVARLWRDRRLREHLVRNGRRRVATTFSESVAVEAFGDVVDRVLTARDRPRVTPAPATSR
ncbi:MAG: glycosyltransferase family 4 protein [Chloroflexota bacterium]|nr:glycosyltransferase family 4 protein [Chloroflexota bacterium]